MCNDYYFKMYAKEHNRQIVYDLEMARLRQLSKERQPGLRDRFFVKFADFLISLGENLKKRYHLKPCMGSEFCGAIPDQTKNCKL